MYGLKRDPFGWLVLCVLLQGVEVFIMKSSGNQCLQASLESNRVLADRCNPDSQLQDWVWKQNWLFNQGTKGCLSADETLIVQIAACENVTSQMWICTKHRFVHAEMFGYLTGRGSMVFLSKERKKNSRWRSTNDTSVCKKPFQENPLITSANAQMLAAKFEERAISDGIRNATQEEETATAKQISYVMEDPTNWNYSILVLSFVTLILGFLILALCSRANKKQKIKELNEARDKSATEKEPIQKTMIQYAAEDNSAETDQMLQTKQAYISMKQMPPSSSPKASPKPGEIVIEWKDGNISSLFVGAKEDDV